MRPSADSSPWHAPLSQWPTDNAIAVPRWQPQRAPQLLPQQLPPEQQLPEQPVIRYAHQPAGAPAHPGHAAFAQDAPATAQPSLQPSRGRAEPDGGGGDLQNPIYQAIFQNSSTAPRDRSAHNIYSASAAPGSLYNTVQANTRARDHDSDPADQHLYQTQLAAGASPTAGSGARTASGARGWPSPPPFTKMTFVIRV